MPAKHVHKRYIILISGVPGTGKTTLARTLARMIYAKVLSEKSLIRKKGVGEWNAKLKEYEVELPVLRRALLLEIQKSKHNVIVEGHLSSEFSLPADVIILTRCKRSTLERRLRKRGYSELKIQENVFCEETNYVGEKMRKHYRTPILEVPTHRSKKWQARNVVQWLKHKLGGKIREKEITHSRTRRVLARR